MRFVLASVTLVWVASASPADDPATLKCWAEKCAGVWVVSAVESNGVITIGNQLVTDALKLYPTTLTLGKDGGYERTHANFYAVEAERGAFTVVRVGGAVVEVDVSATLSVCGDGPKRPEVKFKVKEIWQLKDGDTLQRCYPADPAKVRPTAFKTAKGDGLVLVTYTRVKLPATEKK